VNEPVQHLHILNRFANQQYFMKFCILVILCFLISFHTGAQGKNNKKPKIKGQDALSANEDQSITVLMTHLKVEDPDDWFYPWGFTMKLYPGANYTFDGHVVTPARDFYGELTVQVTVHDGQDESEKYNLLIAVIPVNDKPVITGHESLSTNQNQSITIQLNHLNVTDPDDAYPQDFSLKVHPGNNYSANGHTVTPKTNFSGSLQVTVTVNDGTVDSSPYSLPVQVKVVNHVPQITGQATLHVPEDESITIQFAHLQVVDEDNQYPKGFSINVSSGENYSVKNTTVTPAPDFWGKLSVPVTVNDGKNTSKPYSLSVTVTSVNDTPVISDIETEPILFSASAMSVQVSHSVTVSDVDGDSIMFAEVGLREGYQLSADKLVYSPVPSAKIRGVFDPKTGILTLLGQASPASYTTALRSVYFETLTTDPAESKVIFMLVNDGKSSSEIVERRMLAGEAAISLEIPTGFTPNGDRANDTWKIVPLKPEETYAQASIKVYNKKGQLVYESVGFENEWDGRLNGDLLPADTYFYTIDLNTNTPAGYIKGLVTILR
jgi:gliding motility-associated-like protein